MIRLIWSLVALLAAAAPASAHFVWAVPESSGQAARVIVSETLAVDPRVDIAILNGATLLWRDGSGRDVPLTLARAGHVLIVPLAGARGLLHGHADLGVRPSGDRAYRLHYYPKTIVGDPFGVTVARLPIEIVPTGRPGAVRLQVLVAGKPAPDVDVNLLLPDGSDTVVQTGADGLTEVLPGHGRYGAWARHWEQVSGEFRGEAFGHTRHYATLVFDTNATVSANPAASTADVVASAIAKLPEAAASFGAVAADGWLYVYGGHVVATHRYSTEAVSGRFSRTRLTDMKTWETLPAGPPVQGMNLAAYDGKVYRVGGMQPQNKPGEPEKLQSIADGARFDPATGRWEALPPLPVPRSSHDVVVIGHQLFVVGGWTMKANGPTEWPKTMEVLDLAAEKPEWRSVAQPFTRRAFIAAAFDDRIYVLGGFDEKSRVVRGSSIYDVARGTWSDGPALPGGAMNGFGPAAAAAQGRLFVSVDDGSVHRLSAAGTSWEPVGRATPRIVHRLVASGDDLLIAGGAAKGTNSDLIERMAVR
jgi:outer membrane protein assembly factor BamB